MRAATPSPRGARGLILATALATFAASAQALPRGLRDLDSRRPAPELQRSLQTRGYSLAASDALRGRRWEYWWHGRDNSCVALALDSRDRVVGFESTSETDCVPQGGDPARRSEAARIALAAAQSLGTGPLMHRSHERDISRWHDVKSVAEFERGYRDAVQGGRAREASRGSAYADGFAAGLARREAQASPATGAGAGAAATHAGLSGLRESALERTMKSRGYERYAGFRKGRESFATWRNASTQQCVRTVSRDGVVVSVEDAGPDQCL